MNTVKWFDEKYARGGKISHEDTAAMLKDSERAQLPERVIKTLEEELQDWLFVFESKEGYTPSRQLGICIRINELAQLSNLPYPKIKNYIKRYQVALKKHEGRVVWSFTIDQEGCES